MSFPFLIVFVFSSKEEINSERFFLSLMLAYVLIMYEIDGRYIFATFRFKIYVS